MKQTRTSYLGPLVGALLVLGDAGVGFGQQSFTSGSDGSDGALNIAGGQGTISFNPTALGVDADGDRVFHFTTINVGVGTTVTFPASTLGEGRPIVWLATGPVTIGGTLDLNGRQGNTTLQSALPADAGAGGFRGGPGATAGSSARAGSGPGGGSASQTGLVGGYAGHQFAGPTPAGNAPGGAAYGNPFILPMLGGSGGGGHNPGNGTTGGGGGGGGGAILIASSDSIVVTGTITAVGGNRGSNMAGYGSGGAIRLVAPTLSGTNATLSVLGGGNNSTANGWIRLEAFTHGLSVPGNTISPSNAVTFSGPGLVFLPVDAPKVRVTAVGGVAVTTTPTGSFVTPDVVINSSTPVSIDIATENIPLGTEVRITLIPENGSSVTLTSTALTGSLASGTATAGPVTIPHGFSRFFVAATWAP